MNRKDQIRLFLGLVRACKTGVVTDVLWMGNSQETIFEFMQDALGIDHEEAQDLDYLEEMLSGELHTPGGSK